MSQEGSEGIWECFYWLGETAVRERDHSLLLGVSFRTSGLLLETASGLNMGRPCKDTSSRADLVLVSIHFPEIKVHRSYFQASV